MAATAVVGAGEREAGRTRAGPSRRPEIVLALVVLVALAVAGAVVGRRDALREPRLISFGMGAGSAQVGVGQPQVLTIQVNSIRGPITVESIRLAHPTAGLSTSFGFAPATCGQGFTDAERLKRCSIVAPRGVQISPTSTTLIVISYRLTRPTTVEASDVVVTYRSGGSTHSTALDLDICLSAVGAPACTNV